MRANESTMPQCSSDPEQRLSRLSPWVCWLVVCLAVLVIAAYAGLIPMANWHTDEYHDFGLFNQLGWTFFFQRLLTWSPRPLSETIAGLYFLLERATGRQLIEPFLAVLWATLLIGPLLYLRRRPTLSRLVIAAVVLCAFLLGHSVSEVFYWPMGSVAYATTLAAVSALTFQLLDGRWASQQGQAICVGSVLCAAALAEVGAIFAIYFSASMVLLHLTGCLGRARVAPVWLVPLAFGIVVMALLALGRGTLDEHVVYRGVIPNPSYIKHPIASGLRSFPTYFRQLLVLDGVQMGPRALIEGTIIKSVACLGLLLMLRSEIRLPLPPGSLWVLAALLVSLQATFLTSIAGSYYKFGEVCCERHDTLRQCLLVLTGLGGMGLLARLMKAPSRPRANVGAALLGLAVGMLLLRQVPEIRGAYAVRESVVQARFATWASGHSAGDRMNFLMTTLPPIVDGFMPPEAGTLRLDTHPSWVWELVMNFFGKQEIERVPVK